MADLQLKNIEKIYDNGFHAVHNFNLDIKHGEFIVFVGPSGCGKSTTLRMIAGLEEISSGSLLIDGKECKNEASKDRDIAMVFQNYALYGHMTVYHNMAFSLVLRHRPKEEIHEKVMAAAKILDLTSQLNKLPRQLSGGQRQRVALGRAIVRDPKVFLLDEPLSNLDAKLRSSMRLELALLHKKLGTTFIYVTHDQIEALTLADRIVVMDKGCIKQVGTPIELYENPDNLFVAGFMGNPPMTFMNAKVEDGNIILHNYKLKAASRYDGLIENYNGKEVTFGLRPEHFIISEDGEGVDFTVDFIEKLGAYSLFHGRIGEDKSIVKVNGWKDIEVHETIKVKFNEDKYYLFDKETEDVIRK